MYICMYIFDHSNMQEYMYICTHIHIHIHIGIHMPMQINWKIGGKIVFKK